MKKSAIFWSGGKDCAMALHKVMLAGEYEVLYLVCTMNPEYLRVSMHGIREELIRKQAASTGIPLKIMWVNAAPDNSAYETSLKSTLQELRAEGIETLIYGDIFLEDLRRYREQQLEGSGLEAVFPLWRTPTTELSGQFCSSGFKALSCCISTTYLDKEWVGKELDQEFFKTLPSGVDSCGENGEFHTFCYDGPIFANSIPFIKGELKFSPLVIKSLTDTQEQGFWYMDLV